MAVGADHHIGEIDSRAAMSGMMHDRRNTCGDGCTSVCLVYIRQSADPAQIDLATVEHPFSLVPRHVVDPVHGDSQLPPEQSDDRPAHPVCVRRHAACDAQAAQFVIQPAFLRERSCWAIPRAALRSPPRAAPHRPRSEKDWSGTRVAVSSRRTGRHAFGDYCREGGRNEEAKGFMLAIVTTRREKACRSRAEAAPQLVVRSFPGTAAGKCRRGANALRCKRKRPCTDRAASEQATV